MRTPIDIAVAYNLYDLIRQGRLDGMPVYCRQDVPGRLRALTAHLGLAGPQAQASLRRVERALRSAREQRRYGDDLSIMLTLDELRDVLFPNKATGSAVTSFGVVLTHTDDHARKEWLTRLANGSVDTFTIVADASTAYPSLVDDVLSHVADAGGGAVVVVVTGVEPELGSWPQREELRRLVDDLRVRAVLWVGQTVPEGMSDAEGTLAVAHLESLAGDAGRSVGWNAVA